MSPQRIAILGTGPTALYAATLLAVKGHGVTVYDPKIAWERPCGGSIASSVLLEMPLFEEFVPSAWIEGLKLLTPKNREITIPFERPLTVALRDDLTDFLASRASRAGVVFCPVKLEGFEREGGEWNLMLRGGEERADFLIAADGAGSLARKVLGLNGLSTDATLEVGYDLAAPFDDGRMGLIKFLPEMRGCFWALPKGGGSTVRLWSTGRQLHARPLMERLDNIVQRLLDTPLSDDMARNVAQIPIQKDLSRKNFMGRDWVAIGDAGGFIHPLSKDGLYFGLKSAAALALSVNGSFEERAYWRRLKDQVVKPLRKRSRRLRWWNNHFVVDRILRRTQVSKKSRRFLSELLGAKPV